MPDPDRIPDAAPACGLRIEAAPTDFADWEGLLALVRRAFAYMEGRVDPPSSLTRMDAGAMRAKAAAETLLLAHDGAGRLVGCLFADDRDGALYVGKLAVEPARQGERIGARLMAAAEALARARRLPALELETRVELTGNHAAFARMGFAKIAEKAHAGYDRPTSFTFRKTLD